MINRFVVFATPSLSCSVCTEYLESYRRTTKLLDQAGIKHDLILHQGDPFISHARNALVADFLNNYPDATDLFWIDDDVGWKASKVIEFLESDEDIVCGAPPKKTTFSDWPVDLCVDDKGELIRKGPLVRAALIPFGFIRMKRRVVARLSSVSRIFREPLNETQSRELRVIFQDGVIDGRIYDEDGIIEVRASNDECNHWGEDQVFCLKWAGRLKGEIWLDPTCIFTHRGRAVWTKRFSDFLPLFIERMKESLPKELREPKPRSRHKVKEPA